MPKPEEKARVHIDRQVEQAGWIVQDYKAMNIHAGPGVAVREFPLTTGHTDYMLYADAKAIAHLGAARFAGLEFPLPPREEQQLIVAEIERQTSTLGSSESEVQAAIRRAARLRQSILKRAFEGKLVPQDPNDKPASVLMERINAERSASAAPSPQRLKRRPKAKGAKE